MIRVEAELAPEQKSDFSTRSTSTFSSANSRSKPAPLIPPPTMSTETSGWNRSAASRSSLVIQLPILRRADDLPALSAVFTPPRVQSAAGWTNDVHGAREEMCKHPRTSENSGGEG